jgi:RNA polymerase sigma-70 factor (ECF subfamily)
MSLFLSIALSFPDIPDEDRLLSQARRGNRKAITAIYETFFDPLYSFIRWRVNDESLAEDLTSEVFIKFLSALQSPQAPRQSLRGWLFRVARNVLYDHFRHPDDTDELDDTIMASDDTEAQVIRLADAERIWHMLGTLALSQQEVLILRFGQMLSVQETADIMGRSVSAVKSLQFRAVNALRDALAESTKGVEYGTP